MEEASFTACTGQPTPEQTLSSAQEKEAKTNFAVMSVALLVSIGLMGLKLYGYWITGSSAILSDALESIINVVASGFGLISVRLSAKPADASHPYGHGKIEFFSAGFEGALIILAAAGIFIQGIKQILNPQQLAHLDIGLSFLVAAGLGNLVMGFVELRIAKRTKSLVLEADGKHLLTDVYTSGVVLVGLALVYLTGWFRFDGIIACIAGINVVFLGAKLVRKGFGELMHTSDPELLDEICNLLSRHKKDIWIDIHRLRSWRSGKKIHVDFHLILPKDLPLEEGHREVKELENVFNAHFEGMSDILIHLDPCLEPECPVCGHDFCDTRRERRIHERIWNRQTLTREANSHG
ncbi:MAG: cation diffusion facilitator family transporter [Desulfomonilaceae bacterium]